MISEPFEAMLVRVEGILPRRIKSVARIVVPVELKVVWKLNDANALMRATQWDMLARLQNNKGERTNRWMIA